MDKPQQLQQIIAKCWEDPQFKDQLKNHPTEVLAQQGIAIPSEKKIEVLENTTDTFYLVIPEKTNHLSDEDLNNTAGGWAGCLP